ncbi:hypothetical protein H0H93_005794 [Arthromyces matolae]|nr:hypothetical protein H0H93_005794 [Arthromyces matolae]
MPKAKSQKFYAVAKGRETGVFLTWEDCETQTKGFPGAKFQSFTNAADAEAFVAGTSSATSSRATQGPTVSLSTAPLAKDTKGKKRVMPSDVADESKYDVVFCDGACKGNGQVGSVAGVGVWWGENDPRCVSRIMHDLYHD